MTEEITTNESTPKRKRSRGFASESTETLTETTVESSETFEEPVSAPQEEEKEEEQEEEYSVPVPEPVKEVTQPLLRARNYPPLRRNTQPTLSRGLKKIK